MSMVRGSQHLTLSPSTVHLPVHECVFQQRRHSVDVVFAHLSNVLEQKGERLEHAILHVELRDTVLVHERGQNGERRAGLRHYGDGHGGADSVLSFLDLQVVEECGQHVMRAEGGRQSEKSDSFLRGM